MSVTWRTPTWPRKRLRGGDECVALNLGTGRGTSIREVIAAVGKSAGRVPSVKEGPRRPGDPPELVADLAKAVLSWAPPRSRIGAIAQHAVRWYRDILPASGAVA